MTPPSPRPALDGLPFVDEHVVDTPAAPADVWHAVVATFGHQPAGAAQYARLVGADPLHATGTMPELGAAVAGFRVAEVHPEEMLLLTGRHRFSSYALQFVVEAHGGATRLRAVTSCHVPGAARCRVPRDRDHVGRASPGRQAHAPRCCGTREPLTWDFRRCSGSVEGVFTRWLFQLHDRSASMDTIGWSAVGSSPRVRPHQPPLVPSVVTRRGSAWCGSELTTSWYRPVARRALVGSATSSAAWSRGAIEVLTGGWRSCPSRNDVSRGRI